MGDPLHTLVRDLRRRRGRERRGLALAEGVRLVEEALAAGVPVRASLVSPALEATPRGRALKVALERGPAPVATLDDRAFAELAATDHPQGVLAVIEPPRWSADQIAPAPGRPALVLDAVQDPGNVGTLVRTALALGAAGVLVLPGTAELTNPKTLRASMGALFRLPVAATDDAALRQWAAGHGARLLVADAGGRPLSPGDRAAAVALVVGNEGAGARPELVAWSNGAVAIPLRAAAESLNVAVAAGILLHDLTRSDR